MRNLREYPVTEQEVLEVLAKIPQDNPPGATQIMVGGLNDMIRYEIIQFFLQPENMTKLLERMAV